MDIRSLSGSQLKELKTQLHRNGRKWFFFQQYTTTEGGVCIDMVKAEIKRRKDNKLIVRECNLPRI